MHKKVETMLLWLVVVAVPLVTGQATNSSSTAGAASKADRLPYSGWPRRLLHHGVAVQATGASVVQPTAAVRLRLSRTAGQAVLRTRTGVREREPTTRPASSPAAQALTARPSPPAPAPEPLPEGYPNALPAGCGLSSVSDSRVVGGRVADVGAWPWMAAIYLKTEAQPKVGCGGALVTDRHVLTAAHCVSVGARARQLPARVLTVRVGDHDLNSSDDHTTPMDVEVADVIRHPALRPAHVRQ
ncbi:hypothetical protein MTO96_003435 [Rhipicephalus appendiculatus]